MRSFATRLRCRWLLSKAARLILNNSHEVPYTQDEATGDWSIMFCPLKEGGALGDLRTTLNPYNIKLVEIEMETVDGESPGEVKQWEYALDNGRTDRGMCDLSFTS